MAASASYRIYASLFHVPAHLASLPRASPWLTLRLLLSRAPALDLIDKQMHAVRLDAKHRGLISDLSQTPRMFASWVLGRWSVVLANADDAKVVLTKIETFEKMDFLALGFGTTGRFLGRNVAMVRTHEWRGQRKVINPAFRRGWDTRLFAEPARHLIAQIDQLDGRPADVADWMQRVTLDALAGAAFGQDFQAVRQGNKSDMLKTYDAVMKGITSPVLLLFGKWGRWMPSVRKVENEIARFDEYIFAIIDQKVAEIRARGRDEEVGEEEESKMDLLELMIRAQMKDHGQSGGSGGFTREELRSNVVTFFLAGHDTTANSLTFALYLLGLHQDKQQLARAEVLRVMGDDAIVTPTSDNASADSFPYPSNMQQAQLTYISHIVKEVLRLYPSVLRIPMRDLQSPFTFTSTTPPVSVPKGTLVVVHSYAIQRAKEYWGADADEFKPERWAKLASAPTAAATAPDGTDGSATTSVPIHPGAHNYTWIPFGGGARTCVGNAFSLVEQRVILAMLLLRYTWKVVGNEAALKGRPRTAPGGGLLHAEGIMIEFTRRN
ncbi:cytochrome P450 [Catenaria anguillulae PL171]|uniref:Cytochrome P450 n=1 Tax=Catenaria anguillulae PL171 TaxID=765915 RepID=A0A1Y2HGL2_9FUNG|nr:cytochrome P450 [Catenaria anguillulae PL171]